MLLAPLSLLIAYHQTPMKVTYAKSSAPISKQVETAVVHTIAELERSWNIHDMDLYATLLTDDCQWVNVVGMWWNGKPSVVKAHQAFHHSIFKNVEYVTEQASLRPIANSVVGAVLTVKMGAYTTPDGQKIPSGHTHLSLVLVKKGTKWLISSAQNTPVDPVAAQFDPGKD
ncbi:MAG: SgcJ/EcaC family oxidoreductase [Fimbriimonas sp.]